MRKRWGHAQCRKGDGVLQGFLLRKGCDWQVVKDSFGKGVSFKVPTEWSCSVTEQAGQKFETEL